MNLADKLSEIDKLSPTGWTLEKRNEHYSFIIFESETKSVFCGDPCLSINEALDSVLEKKSKGIDFYNEIFIKK